MAAEPVPATLHHYDSVTEAMAAIFRRRYGHINKAMVAVFLATEERLGENAERVATINEQLWPASEVFRQETLMFILVLPATDGIGTITLMCPTEQFMRPDIGEEGR